MDSSRRPASPDSTVFSVRGFRRRPLVRPQPCWSRWRGDDLRTSSSAPRKRFLLTILKCQTFLFSEGPVAGQVTCTHRRAEVHPEGQAPDGPSELSASEEEATQPGAAPKQENVGRWIGVVLIIILMHQRSGRSSRSQCPHDLPFCTCRVGGSASGGDPRPVQSAASVVLQ